MQCAVSIWSSYLSEKNSHASISLRRSTFEYLPPPNKANQETLS